MTDPRTLHLLKVVVDPRTLHLTQSRGRPTQLIFHSKSWQNHAPYISFKVVANLRTQIHGTLRIKEVAISSINNKCQMHMADTRGNCVFVRLKQKHSYRPELFLSKVEKGLRRLTTYWFITSIFAKAFLVWRIHEAHNVNELLLIRLLQKSKRMANSEAIDSKGQWSPYT